MPLGDKRPGQPFVKCGDAPGRKGQVVPKRMMVFNSAIQMQMYLFNQYFRPNDYLWAK